MALLNVSFLLGLVVLFYLATFVVFAILRIFTGISIQRVGLSSLRRIAYTPRDGIKIEIRGLGIQIHRPTFAQPTWLSVAITELRVIVDLAAATGQKAGTRRRHDSDRKEASECGESTDDEPKSQSRGKTNAAASAFASKAKAGPWERLTAIKDKIKRLHTIIPWIRLVDVVAARTSLVVTGVGSVHIGTFMASVDTRPIAVDRSRLFQHTKTDHREGRPAEWTIAARSVLFTPEDQESTEIIDHFIINIHGFLVPAMEGLRDASVSLKVGRLHAPYDGFLHSARLAQRLVPRHQGTKSNADHHEVASDVNTAEPHEDHIANVVSEARGFIASILRGIHEVSVAVSFFGLTKRVDSVRPTGQPVYLNMSMKEVGMDVFRLNPSSPAHSMYFSRNDVAHRALLSAISMSFGLDDGEDVPQRLLYVPMTTATIRTTLPAKLLQFSSNKQIHDRNTNVFFANLVITSPSLDLNPRHLPLVLAIAASRQAKPATQSSKNSHHLMSILLPKASIKVSVHEPVVRVALPPRDPVKPGHFDFDLLVSAVSSIYFEMESSHSENIDEQVHYALSSIFRVSSHRLYYQTASRQTHNLLLTESIELKAQVSAAPTVFVVASLDMQTFSVFMVRPEISDGVRQVVSQLRTDVKSDKLWRPRPRTSENNFVRKLPPWLHAFQAQVSDFNIDVAGVDTNLSSRSRGFALHLDSWTTDYKAKKDDIHESPRSRRSGGSHSKKPDDDLKAMLENNPPSPHVQTDGRRLAIHVRGLEAFIIDSVTSMEHDSFISMPKSEIALTTSNDGQGPIFHLNAFTKAVFLQYDLFKHYALGVAVITLRKTFIHGQSRASSGSAAEKPEEFEDDSELTPQKPNTTSGEIVAVTIKVPFIQLKAMLPSDLPLMLHIHGIEGGKHRWTIPSVHAKAARLLCRKPGVKRCWARIVSVKGPRVDIRESRHRQHSRKSSDRTTAERSIDVVSDAIRIGIPHQLIVHNIFDSIVNTVKATAQLHHFFRTESEEYILAKHPEGPKKVPRISVRSHVLLFEIEDGAFEWKLSTIFRVGLIEQKQRIARDEAFRLKKQRIERNGVANPRARSTNRRARDLSPRGPNNENSHEAGGPRRSESLSPRSGRAAELRYSRGKQSELSCEAKTTIEDAWQKLQRYNSESWKKRVDAAMKNQTSAIQELRDLLWGLDNHLGLPDEVLERESILKIPQRPALMSVLMSDIYLQFDKPSFPLEELPSFMHRVGKGLPLDTQFGLLIPLSARFDLGEARMSLRDYPLPLLHIPAIKAGQSPRLPSWSLTTNFVIGEEFRGFESTRDFKIMIVPPEKMDPDQGGFAIDVRRTVSPVKTYSEINVEINTARDTIFTWGSSYQPAIQDMMQVIEGFTKPQIDPSEKVGFWDKIRLSFHSKVQVAWKGGGDVHLMLKGTRDPYIVTGHGAGLVMIWRNDVKWSIWKDDNPYKFMTVDSGDYVLAVPDFSHYAQDSLGLDIGRADRAVAKSRDVQSFKKVVMKLSGKVRWQAGIMFERDLDDGKRSFDFEPHYNVTLRNPVHIKEIQGKSGYDAFKGFRSNHIHLSIDVSAPSDRDWTNATASPSSNYNSVHLTPRFFTHFFAWWSMFSGTMSLPIRQGSLWPAVDKTGKKFGRHIATIKYSLLLSPLFISHIYKHKESEEYNEDGDVAVTGLKMRLDSFLMDVHQRKEEFKSEVKGLNKMVKTSGMKINEALLDLVSADLRAVSATVTGTSAMDVREASKERLANFGEFPKTVDLEKFEIPDNDFSWIDVDDFVEVDWMLPTDADPETSILPLGYAPRFTYRRETDHQGKIDGDSNRSSPFGDEETHDCIMLTQSDSRRVQLDLVKARIVRIDELIDEHNKIVGEQELSLVKEVDDRAGKEKILEDLHDHSTILQRKRQFLLNMQRDMERIKEQRPSDSGCPDPGEDDSDVESHRRDSNPQPNQDGNFQKDSILNEVEAADLADHISDFNNRFSVHNMQLKWNNSLRNTMLRYIHQVSQRRGFVYYTSRRAVKFILDIIEEQKLAKVASSTPSDDPSRDESPDSRSDNDDDVSVQDRIQQLLQDGKNFVNAHDPESEDKERRRRTSDNAEKHVANDFITQNTYHVRLVAPQIQLQSEKNTKAAALVTARGMRLKVYQVMDRDRIQDDVSGLVQRRFTAEMDNVQFLVTNKQLISTEHLHMYSGNRYGVVAPGSSWPPWIPMEAMFEPQTSPFGFARIIERTSLSMRYDKFNKLRLKYNESVMDGQEIGNSSMSQTPESHMDQLWIDFPKVHAICDSTQYYSMYIIALDLLMYNEPLEKTRNERLEKIMLASDFTDLRGAPEMVCSLQARIRQLEEIKTHFHIHEDFLDRRGWADRVSMEQDLTNCEDELFFMMKAITTSQRKFDDRTDGSEASGVLRWYLSASEIVWHLVKDIESPLVEFQLADASYERTDYSDGSHRNAVEIDRIQGLNLLPNAIYPNIIAAYTERGKGQSDKRDIKMLRINWLMLEAIAGIPVVDHFEVNLFPLTIQLEYQTGKELFEYVFPGMGQGEEGFSPFMVRHQIPHNDDEIDMEESAERRAQREKALKASMDQTSGGATGAGSLEYRLTPTLTLPDSGQAKEAGVKSKYGLGIHLGDRFSRSTHSFSEARASIANSHRAASQRTLSSKKSSESFNASQNGRDTSDGRKKSIFQRSPRSASQESKKSAKTSKKDADELEQMLRRASNYMTLAYVKIPSVMLCLSYKGKGARNVEDVHQLVFRMPTIEYRNKTWSNMDLVLALKKDVIRALISHTGAIISNKFSKHRPGAQQQSRLRELASSAVVLSSQDVSKVNSAASSVRGTRDDEDEPRISTSSHSRSYASSMAGIDETPEIGIEPATPLGDEELDSANGDERNGIGRHDSKRGRLSRHLTEMTAIARPRADSNDRETNGAEESDHGQPENSDVTPRRRTLVRKLLHKLDRDGS